MIKKSILKSLLNCTLILITVVIHKIVYRLLCLGYQNLFLYWGIFISIFFMLSVCTITVLKIED